MTLNSEYRKMQISPLDLRGDYKHQIKIRNPNNNKESLWLNITFDEYMKICDILDVK